jgi:hypothetical protein
MALMPDGDDGAPYGPPEAGGSTQDPPLPAVSWKPPCFGIFSDNFGLFKIKPLPLRLTPTRHHPAQAAQA